MNIKIRALVDQARRSEPFECSFSKAEWLETFARVVAQECANICEEMAAKCAGLPGDGALARDCANWIKHDFGVEE